MRRSRKRETPSWPGISALLLVLLAAADARADVTYQYTGKAFVTVDDAAHPSGSYTTADRVSGTFTVPAPLGPMALTDISGDLIGFRISDGRNIATESDSQVFTFMVGVDGSGQIETWWISVGDPDVFVSVGDTRRLISTQNVPGQTITDWAYYYECWTLAGSFCVTDWDYAEIDFDPGSWSIAAPVPTLIWPLRAAVVMTTALAGLTGLRRREAIRLGRSRS